MGSRMATIRDALRPLVAPLLIGVVILASVAVMVYVQTAVKRIESGLPLRVMQEKRDMEQVARNFYEFLATTEAALVRPTSGGVESVQGSLLAVERDLATLRDRYTFDTLIGASALHAVLSPVVVDIRTWLSEGFGAVPADSPLVLEVVATRARDALSKVYDKTTEADRIAYEILERQSKEMRRLNERLVVVLGAFGLLAVGFVWVAIRQQRAARGQRAAEAARSYAQARLHDALESTSEGFAFFDDEERLVVCNSRYRDYFLAGVGDVTVPGRTFEEIVSAAMHRGIVGEPGTNAAQWIADRLERFRSPHGPFALRFSDGRWVQVNERKTADGGTVAVYADISELKRREQELVGAKEIAEEANQAKSTFLANVSHELRTPLTSILGFTRIIQRRLDETIFPEVDAGSSRVKRAMSQVEKNLEIMLLEGQRLTALINNVLDLEKIEAGEMIWQLEPLDVARLLDQAAAATQSLYESQDLEFRLKASDELPKVLGDRDRVIQVIVNLISNAVKFTSRGRVCCKADYDGNGKVSISVSDTGVGIATADQPRVFEKFRQVGDTLTEKPSGTGLGLPICKEIVEHLGGTICVESEPGKGSTFRFTLPVAEETTPVSRHASSS